MANPVGRSHSAQDRACAPPGLSAAYKPNAGPGASAGGDLCSTGSALRRYPPWPPVPTGAPRVQGPLIFLAAGDPASNRAPEERGRNEALRGQVVMPPTSESASEAVLASFGV